MVICTEKAPDISTASFGREENIKNGNLWNGKYYDEEGLFTNVVEGDTQGITITFFLLVLLGLGVFFVLVFVVSLRLITKSVAKHRTKSQIELMKAQEEAEYRQTVNWKCISCGASNCNREYCGAVKTAKKKNPSGNYQGENNQEYFSENEASNFFTNIFGEAFKPADNKKTNLYSDKYRWCKCRK